MFQADLLTYACRFGVVLLLLPIHEYAHARTALALGDTTALEAGRVDLNPFVHLDIFGTALLMLAGIGWAKPVPVDPRGFRKPRRDMAIVAMAGPMANLLMGLLLIVGAQFAMGAYYNQITAGAFTSKLSYLIDVLTIMAQISVNLAVFNLLPIPPLDGSRLLEAVLPPHALQRWYIHGEAFRSILLLLVLITPVFDVVIYFFSSRIMNFFVSITSFIPMLF